MNTIPEQQLFDRWDTIPMILREAMTSPVNSEFVWKTAEAEHLPEEKIAIVSRLTGYTLMGFLHPEDIAKEIQDALGINPNIAASIANTLNSRLFNPLRTDLEKIYAPAVEESRIERPVLVEEVKKPVSLGQGSGVKSQGLEMPIPATPTPAMSAGVPPPPAGGPKIISTELGQGSGVRGQGSMPPAPAPIKMPEAVKPVTPPIPTPVPTRPVAPPVPKGPVIIHRESEVAPIKPASGFKLEAPEPKSKTARPWPGIPPRPAQIEIGPVMEMKPSASGQASGVKSQGAPPAPPRVAYYSETRTPFAPAAPEKVSQEPKPQMPSMLMEIKPSPLKPITPAPMPPNNLPIMPQKVKTGGVSNRLTPKISPAGKSLPDPLKEPELMEPEDKSNIKHQNAK